MPSQLRGTLQQLGANRYLLQGLRIQGQDTGDLEVRVSRRVTQVGADGVLGLDFLAQFTYIHFHVPTMRLTLTRP